MIVALRQHSLSLVLRLRARYVASSAAETSALDALDAGALRLTHASLATTLGH